VIPDPGDSSLDGGHTDGVSAEDAVLRPVREQNAFEETVNRLLQTIRLGLVAPGGALPPERDLAARLAVSRDTVRAAITSLAEAGYLVSRRGRYGGTFVSDSLPEAASSDSADTRPSSGAIEDALVFRSILEVGAARAAAARTLTAPERELLWSSLVECRSASGDDYRRLDSRLHLVIGELTGSPSLLPALADNRMRVNRLLDGIPLLERNIVHSNEQHEAITLAILTGDIEGAASSMAEHLDGSAALLRGFLS
jgi:DNA-binding FadR family transcriptional regulator